MKRLSRAKQYFKTVEELYNLRMSVFISTAASNLRNTDFVMDAVHDAFVKAQEYANKHPGRNVREQLINSYIIRACKKINKRHGFEISIGSMDDFDG